MTTFTAVDGSTVTPITRADLMKHPAFAGLNVDTEGNPCVWLNSYTCQACTSEQVDWSDDWSCGCDDDCPECGKSHSPNDQQWLPACEVHGPDYCLWEALPEAGSPEGAKAQEDAAMAEHADHVDRRTTATILAALRFWQRGLTRNGSALLMASEGEIATDGGTLEPMTAAEIDDLCEKINCGPVAF